MSLQNKITKVLKNIPIKNLEILVDHYKLNPDDKIQELLSQLSNIFSEKLNKTRKIGYMESSPTQENTLGSVY